MDRICRDVLHGRLKEGQMIQDESTTQTLREEVLSRRAELSSEEIDKASWFASQYIIHSKLFKESQTIACYLAVRGEIDPQFIIEACQKEGKKCYLPVIDKNKVGEMYFVEYQPGNKLVENFFGINEPEYEQDKIIEPKNLDLVIMPLAAFDKKGHRLGMGGGYYDRAFAFKQTTQIDQKPFLCGFAYAFQEVLAIKPSEWDVQMDAIATEEKLIFLR